MKNSIEILNFTKKLLNILDIHYLDQKKNKYRYKVVTSKMEKQIEEIGQKKIELTKKYNTEIENMKNGLKQLEIDEIPDAAR